MKTTTSLLVLLATAVAASAQPGASIHSGVFAPPIVVQQPGAAVITQRYIVTPPTPGWVDTVIVRGTVPDFRVTPDLIVGNLSGQIARSLPGQVVAPLPGQVVGALPGQMIRPLPGQIVGALPGQIVGALPGQIVP